LKRRKEEDGRRDVGPSRLKKRKKRWRKAGKEEEAFRGGWLSGPAGPAEWGL